MVCNVQKRGLEKNVRMNVYACVHVCVNALKNLNACISEVT